MILANTLAATTWSFSLAIGSSLGGFYARWFPKLTVGQGTAPTSYAEFGPLAEHLRFAERNCRKLARSTFYGMSRWQAETSPVMD